MSTGTEIGLAQKLNHLILTLMLNCLKLWNNQGQPPKLKMVAFNDTKHNPF